MLLFHHKKLLSYKRRECFNPKCKQAFHLKHTQRKQKSVIGPKTNVWALQETQEQRNTPQLAYNQTLSEKEPFLGVEIKQTRLDELEKNVKYLTTIVPILVSALTPREHQSKSLLN